MNTRQPLSRIARCLRQPAGWPVLVLLVLVLAAPLSTRAEETALDRYMTRPDAEYGWQIVARHEGEGYTTLVVELTSQSWRTADEVDRPVWKHWLTVVRPNEARGGTAFLLIGGGNNESQPPRDASQRVRQIALDSGTVAAELFMVPNQPLRFADSPDAARYEDDLVAYSRVRYIATADETWLVRLAMVKSGVRAMDAVQEILAAEAEPLAIEHFTVAGGSKRGWTTWLVAVVDPRVVAIAPLVIDALNSEEITRHHYRAYGFFSPALNDYVRHGLFPDKVGTPEYQAVLHIEDPYHYRHRERLRIPKYIINSAGDQFFLPDNSRFYYADLPEEKLLRYVPNTKHSLEGSDAGESLRAFYHTVVENRARPHIEWSAGDEAGPLVVTTADRPAAVHLWQAFNPEARDFRLDTIGAAWQSTPLEPASAGRYVARVEPPEEGFKAYFVELSFDVGAPYPLKLTTGVEVVPDVLPYEFPQLGK